ncbi:testis-expressed protein 47-like [Gigantopelta aegis]|uniref:testis-expressed protein 47-like n=1 Tax=Gigantopelta aegis TaxID=1735272 RepID=UPI001B88D93A|nr:testis-expressed protein 47-like [Gigantopelta aegis]
MASEEGVEDLLIEIHRPSLLEVIEDRNRTLNKKSQIHRLVYIAKLSNENFDRAEVGHHYEKYIKKLQEDFQSEPTTGLMLIYMKYIVHVVESSSETLLKMIKFLHQGVTSEHGFESVAKILIISHDIPYRIFQQWGFRTIDIEAHQMEAYEPPGSTEELVIDVLRQLLKMGSFLATQPKTSLKSAMDSIHERIPEHLPQQAAVHYLLAEDDPCMILPKEFIDIYEKPFDVTLEGDRVWPIQTKLFPYN